MLAPVLEGQSRPCHKVDHRARDEHLARSGEGADALRQVHTEPGDVVSTDLDFARVQASPNVDTQGLDPLTYGLGAPYRATTPTPSLRRPASVSRDQAW
jgi:hypothetical protein